jgi:hypothetical protein|tara:strand:+ start:3494 stop:4138 length:645 start_codon:yes stop_codon:yes gene_type:complete
MSLEKRISFRKKALASTFLLAFLPSCGIPIRAADEVLDLTSMVVSLPVKTLEMLPWLKREHPLNGCTETFSERTCTFYVEEDNGFGIEKYYAVLRRTEEPDSNCLWELTLAYDGDLGILTDDGKPAMQVIKYAAENPQQFVAPYFGNGFYDKSEFNSFFEQPRKKRLDESDNRISKYIAENPLDLEKFKEFRGMVHDKIATMLEIQKFQQENNE